MSPYGSAPKRFTITEEHIKLLRRMYVGWEGDEFGAPEIDPKRPYGNSNVIDDMAEILGVPTIRDEWGEEIVTEEDAKRLRVLHEETRTVLQILLQLGDLASLVGEYDGGEYGYRWTRMETETA